VLGIWNFNSHNCGVFKPAGIIFLGALIFLAGCASTPPMPEKTISSPEPVPEAAGLNWVDPNAAPKPHAPPAPKIIPPLVMISNRPPAALYKPAAAPATTWMALNRWTDEHQLAPPRLMTKTPLTTYKVSSPNGAMILALGSHEANWNRIEIHLGFEPQMIDGQVALHGLDLQKILEPLLCAPPLTFGTNRVIVIDPGHGGLNVGTHSVTDGRFEKEFTLDVAKRLRPLLETNGWTVFLTRTSDAYVTNFNRVTFAETHHADFFISLHFNSAAPDTKQAGLETYYLTPTGMPSMVTRIYSDIRSENLPNNAFDAQNLQLAVRLQSALLHAAGMEDRGVRPARFMDVLRGQRRPAVLIEAGYLSNPAEANKIGSAAYRQKLAEAIAAALRLPPEMKNSNPESTTSAANTNQLSHP